jgi:hypothetical protein
MLAGDTLAGRFVPQRWRERLGAPLRLLLAAPHLIFILHPALPLAAAAVTLALAPGLRAPGPRGPDLRAPDPRAPAHPELAIPAAEDQHFQQRGAEDV